MRDRTRGRAAGVRICSKLLTKLITYGQVFSCRPTVDDNCKYSFNQDHTRTAYLHQEQSISSGDVFFGYFQIQNPARDQSRDYTFDADSPSRPAIFATATGMLEKYYNFIKTTFDLVVAIFVFTVVVNDFATLIQHPSNTRGLLPITIQILQQ